LTHVENNDQKLIQEGGKVIVSGQNISRTKEYMKVLSNETNLICIAIFL
jgi:hypothetical protein